MQWSGACPFSVMKRSEEKKSGVSMSFVTGVVALVFLIIGYQTALFVHQAAVMKIVANRDEPDTVFVYASYPESSGNEVIPTYDCPSSGSIAGKEVGKVAVRKNAEHSPRAEAVRMNMPRKVVESFNFNPNTVTVEELCRLGFTPKQAQSIDNYRRKGGRFHRKSDFQKSYVVSDSIFTRLSPHIEIPLVDLNLADSAGFDALPGIGGWFASKIIEYRRALGGYSCKEQLLDIYRFDQEKYDGLCDLITVSPDYISPYPLWTLPADSLCKHPYIRNLETAKAIVLYRDNNPPESWTVEELLRAGVLSEESASKLRKCVIAGTEKSIR